MKQPLLLLVSLIGLAACSSHLSSLRPGSSSDSVIYVIDESKAFSLAYDAIVAVLPDVPVFDMDGPVRGFRISRTFGRDYYNEMVRIFPVSGMDPTGRPIQGYYFEIYGQGTFFEGPSTDREIFDGIQNRFAAAGRAIVVTAVTRASYMFERDRWRLQSKNSNGDASPPPNGSTAKTRLQELDDLKKSGLVTDQEYEAKRKAILEGL